MPNLSDHQFFRWLAHPSVIFNTRRMQVKVEVESTCDDAYNSKTEADEREVVDSRKNELESREWQADNRDDGVG